MMIGTAFSVLIRLELAGPGYLMLSLFNYIMLGYKFLSFMKKHFPFLTEYLKLYEFFYISVVFFYGTIPQFRGKIDTTNIKFSKEYKQSMRVPNNLDNIIVGLLLGDLHISRDFKNSRLQFRQGDSNKAYLLHLHDLFINFTTASVFKDVSFHKKEKKFYTSWTFKTLSMPCFNYYHDLFYYNKVKVIPANIKDLLTPIGLAYWAMDDGGYDGVGDFKFFINNYTKSEVELLISALYINFSLVGKLNEVKPGQYAIRIGRANYFKLRDLILPYFHESMLYKLPDLK